MLTNKHFIAALIITPILAIIAYFATDYAVSERPHKAVGGNSYPLAAKPNCRYQSGRCTLKNGDVEIDLRSAQMHSDKITMQLDSALPLEGVKIALATGVNDLPPFAMRSTNSELTQWQAVLPHQGLEDARLLVVVSVNESIYYGETEATFTTYQTSFPQKNFQ